MGTGSVKAMKRPALSAAGVLTGSLVLVALTLALCPRSVLGITAEELKASIDAGEGLVIIDVRSSTHFALGRIPGALGVPAAICRERDLPPLGRVVVYGDGIDLATTLRAAADLDAKDGIEAEVLEGGYGRWEALGYLTVGPPTFRRSEPPAIFYDQLLRAAASNPDLVLVDMRRGREPQGSGGELAGAVSSPAAPPLRQRRLELGEVSAPRDVQTVPVTFAQVRGPSGASQYILVSDAGVDQAAGAAALLDASSVRRVDLPLAVLVHMQATLQNDPDIVLIDLRQRRASYTLELVSREESLLAEPAGLTDLGAVFPGVPVVELPDRGPPLQKVAALPGAALQILRSRDPAQHELQVLIDDGDGRAEKLADRLRAAGRRRVMLLAGGEEILVRKGKPGLRKQISR